MVERSSAQGAGSGERGAWSGRGETVAESRPNIREKDVRTQAGKRGKEDAGKKYDLHPFSFHSGRVGLTYDKK